MRRSYRAGSAFLVFYAYRKRAGHILSDTTSLERKVHMKRLLTIALLTSVTAAVLLAAPGVAVAPKTYQVTGPVLTLTNDMIAVQKGSDRWEIGRDAGTKVTGDLKTGVKVMVEYRMTATTITVQQPPAPKTKAAPPAKKGD